MRKQPVEQKKDPVSYLKLDTGYTTGVFDLIHDGHLRFLKECKKNVDILIVGVDDDFIVQQKKGYHRPYDGVEKRLLNVKNSGFADIVFIKKNQLRFFNKANKTK